MNPNENYSLINRLDEGKTNEDEFDQKTPTESKPTRDSSHISETNKSDNLEEIKKTNRIILKYSESINLFKAIFEKLY